ncbi:hypothetical protein DHEL01_v205053 [Diaporthe helianthi]|uniref:Uncharacterized protein n=1 Tax=Diaporthe helianthi TaxID=158607 RepID=A0A2P5I244_DIAHE|nr:hypothetical protein DHEL01_v205053 [Diaporthe helianthi]
MGTLKSRTSLSSLVVEEALRESLFSPSLGRERLWATSAGVCWPQPPTDWCPLQSPESNLWFGTGSRLDTTCFLAPPKIGGRYIWSPTLHQATYGSVEREEELYTCLARTCNINQTKYAVPLLSEAWLLAQLKFQLTCLPPRQDLGSTNIVNIPPPPTTHQSAEPAGHVVLKPRPPTAKTFVGDYTGPDVQLLQERQRRWMSRPSAAAQCSGPVRSSANVSSGHGAYDGPALSCLAIG